MDPKGFLGWMGAEAPKLLASVVVLVLGWWIKDSVDLSIKQRQLDLSYAKEMQGLLETMMKPNAEKGQYDSAAVVLSSYGEGALPALLSQLPNTGMRADAAVLGLASLSFTRPKSICDPLARVLMSRGRALDWSTHKSVVLLLGQGECANSVRTLRKYRKLVVDAMNGHDEQFGELVSRKPLAPAAEYPELLQAIDQSLQVLDP